MKARRLQRGIDVASWLTLIVTVGLFSISLFEKGFTHDILLEAGVFLVSIKLVLASHREQIETKTINRKLDVLLRERARSKEPTPHHRKAA